MNDLIIIGYLSLPTIIGLAVIAFGIDWDAR